MALNYLPIIKNWKKEREAAINWKTAVLSAVRCNIKQTKKPYFNRGKSGTPFCSHILINISNKFHRQFCIIKFSKIALETKMKKLFEINFSKRSSRIGQSYGTSLLLTYCHYYIYQWLSAAAGDYLSANKYTLEDIHWSRD